MSNDHQDDLQPTFDALRAKLRDKVGKSVPSEELDALLDERESADERRRLAHAVLADRRSRAEFVRLLAIDREIARVASDAADVPTPSAPPRRAHSWIVGAGLLAAAAGLLLVLVLSPPGAPQWSVQVVGAEPAKDRSWPGIRIAHVEEALELRTSETSTGSRPATLHWVAYDCQTRTSRAALVEVGQPVAVASLLPSGSPGLLLIGVTTGPAADLALRLQELAASVLGRGGRFTTAAELAMALSRDEPPAWAESAAVCCVQVQ
ncbi:MAG: hypothetical protein ACE37K_23085 [Planctomycetota bacterium]